MALRSHQRPRAPQPILVNVTTVDRDPVRAKDVHDQYAFAYARFTIEHDDCANPRLERINGFEYYAGVRRNIEKHGLSQFNRFLADLQLGGTPDELVEQTVERVRALTAGGVVNVLGFGGMPADVVDRNVATVCEHVLARLRAAYPYRDMAPSSRWTRRPQPD